MTPSKFYAYVATSYVFPYVYVAVYGVFPTFVVDLRSGARKSFSVPPPRRYRRRVMSTPSKLDSLRQTAAERRAAAASEVPPSVEAAAAAADIAGHLDRETHHDFDTWDGDHPPGTKIQADIHAEIETDRVDVNVTSRSKARIDGLASESKGDDLRDADRISSADNVSDVTPPPPVTGFPSGLNPFTPEWFTQLIGSAVTAAATAVANNTRSPPPAVNSAAPRRLNDRKVPDFWEDRPEFWFRIFDAHLAHFRPSEKLCFDAMLPLLTPAARAAVHPVIRTPGQTPYSKAREVLLRHFGRTPRQLAREIRDTRSLGDKLPTELLDHMEGLLPDIRVLFEVILLDSLPANARIAALQHSDVRSMAQAADAVILENRASSELSRAAAEISSISRHDPDFLPDGSVAQPFAPVPSVNAVSSGASSQPRSRRPPLRKADGICAVHNLSLIHI